MYASVLRVAFALLSALFPPCHHEYETFCHWTPAGPGFEVIALSDGSTVWTFYGPWHEADGSIRADVDFTLSVRPN